MIIKKRRKEVHEEPVQKKKKKVKNSGSQAVVIVEKDVQAVIRSQEDDQEDDQLEMKTELRKKKNIKNECLDQLELKKKKKKSKKKQPDSELLEEACSESFVSGGGHLDSEPQGESEDQIKILKKKKKKAQCHCPLLLKNNQGSGVELSDCCTDGTKENEFSLKKSRKHPALCLESAGEAAKKKKKKVAFPFEDIQEAGKVCNKPHKSISQEKTFPSENHGTEVTQNDGESSVRRKKRKKNKDKSDSVLLLADDQDNICRAPDSPVALCDFRKRQRKNSQEIAVTDREEEDTSNSGSNRETRRKKKKSKDASPLIWEGDQGCSRRVPHQHLPAQHEVESEEKELSGKTCGKTIKENGEVIKKKKKIQKEEEERTDSKAFSSSDSALKSQTPALPGNEVQRAERGTGDAVDGVLCSSNHLLCDRKRKKSRKEAPQDSAEEPGSKGNAKKKMIKRKDMGEEALEGVDDVTVVQEKKGNCDEVNIDKDVPLGQWSTAAFQSSEEKMKFFRLMGGFKKGAVPSHHLSATPNKPNMALTREGEEKLQQALKMEFDKAMDLKQHRGIGLGFQPAANKKVYIDKYTSRSVKFED
ncbi:lysine-rich nucleolar protein 1 isoform 2-T3 [Porphyrio hochstetteri]